MADNRTHPIVSSNSSIIQGTRSPSNELLSPTIDQITSMNDSTNVASNQYAIQNTRQQLQSSYNNRINEQPSTTDAREYDEEHEVVNVNTNIVATFHEVRVFFNDFANYLECFTEQ